MRSRLVERAFVALVAAMMLATVRAETECANAIPFVVWSSRSGLGPFKEIRGESYKSAGWLKWLLEPHQLYCEVPIEKNESYSIGVAIPDDMVLTHVSCHPEWASRVDAPDNDCGWCKVCKVPGQAEITISALPSCRRVISLSLAFQEAGWFFYRSRLDESPKFFVHESDASLFESDGKVYKTLSVDPCATPLAAARAAEGIFGRVYGEQVVEERPWRVLETNGCYIVTGSLPEGHKGGCAQLKVQKDSGQVWVFYHGK